MINALRVAWAARGLRNKQTRPAALVRLVELGDPCATPALVECLATVLREIEASPDEPDIFDTAVAHLGQEPPSSAGQRD